MTTDAPDAEFDPLEELSMLPPPSEAVGRRTGHDLEDAEARTREAAARSALSALEALLVRSESTPRAPGKDPDRARSLLLGLVDHALTDPHGYLKRLRAERSELLRKRFRSGVSAEKLAAENGCSTARIYALMKNNRTYTSPEREAALAALAAEGAAARKAKSAERAAVRERAAAERAAKSAERVAARVAEREAAAAVQYAADVATGRVLAARIDSGARPAELATPEMSWQRVAYLARLSRAADTV